MPRGRSVVPSGPTATAAAAWSWVEKMLQLTQRTSAPSSTSVSISTAVCTVMCRLPMMRAPASGRLPRQRWRKAMSPGISCSARRISLRPQLARLGSFTLKGRRSAVAGIGVSRAAPHQPRWEPASFLDSDRVLEDRSGLSTFADPGSVPGSRIGAEPVGTDLDYEFAVFRLGLLVGGLALFVWGWRARRRGEARVERRLRLALLGVLAATAFGSYFYFWRFSRLPVG